ncbi:hypothetical protein C4D60_Mb01t29830 [Musa balbisiana]|uniref:Uncharacterized protein n=1 Tax=Musa balbisiana TaxID=52838 RepID=A0A4S8JRQ5_MUSBA|nr:hypothetical protein C4D60_Mb01t29830 [Musa balbisiana]
MKNVAKCDTWCELQNPVNHRVFERKLRPRPSGYRARLPGRHAFDASPMPPSGGVEACAEDGPPCPRVRLAEERAVGGCRTRRVVDALCEPYVVPSGPGRGPRTQVVVRVDATDRDPRSGGATR